MSKVISASEAVNLIKDNDTIAVSGFGLAGVAEELLIALEERYASESHPQGLTAMHSSAVGNRDQKGMSHLAAPGLLKRWIGGIAAASPRLGEAINNNELEAYNLPQGVITRMYHDIATKGPGVITKIGLGTFVDPDIEGAKMNRVTTEEIVKKISLDGEDWLRYPTFPINVALIRGTYADEAGNITLDKEGLDMEVQAIAQAAHNSGGIVIAQVEALAETNTLNPKQVKVPGILVDHIVVAQPENQYQTENTLYNPAFSGEIRVPLQSVPALPLDAKKVIARRAAMELRSGAIFNLGVGIPVNVSAVAAEEGVNDDFVLTTEAGSVGGVPAGLKDFGHAYNSQATVDMDAQFDFYDGGGIDLSVLGLAQTDATGNVNVSKFNGRVAGAGGFIDISQTAKKLVFAGTFTAAGLKEHIADGQLVIDQEGRFPKFVASVEQITFSGQYAAENQQPVVYVTERAVFELTPAGLMLTEIAPGMDLDADILAHMDFKPIISDDLKQMDAGLFAEEWGGLSALVNQTEI